MAKKEETAVQVQPKAVVPAGMEALWVGDSGSGMEGTDKDSFAIPFIRVLQQLSPQCTPGKTGYNPAAKAGMILNTVTGELVSGETGIIFVPCAFQRRFIQWAPRGSNGGYRGEFMPEDIAAKISSGILVRSEEDGKIYLAGKTNPKKDDYFADTRNHFGLVLTEDGPIQALLSLTSTQIKKSKQLMGMLSSVMIGGKTPPTWMSKFKMTSVLEANDSGSWHGVRFEAAGFIDSPELYEMGKAFHETIAAGAARIVYDEAEGNHAEDSGWGEKN